MLNIRWKGFGRLLLAAAFAYIGAYLVGPDHIVQSYVRWGYPPWAHFVAGALFLSAAVLLPARQTCWFGVASALCVLVPAMTTCALHGDFGHALQGPPIIALVVWLARDRPPPAADLRAR
jgi:hypothetical protein